MQRFVFFFNSAVCFFCLGIGSAAFGQGNSGTDTAFVGSAITSTFDLYKKSVGEHTGIMNGRSYTEGIYQRNQHPYFKSSDWAEGSVTYGGETYLNLDLKYNIITDEIICQFLGHAHPIALVPEKVERFYFEDLHFVRLVDSTLSDKGFYQVLYDGKRLDVVARRMKKTKENVTPERISIEYLLRDRYYIRYGVTYYHIRSWSSVFAIFPHQKRAIKQFVREQKISITKDPAVALSRVAKFYDLLQEK